MCSPQTYVLPFLCVKFTCFAKIDKIFPVLRQGKIFEDINNAIKFYRLTSILDGEICSYAISKLN